MIGIRISPNHGVIRSGNRIDANLRFSADEPVCLSMPSASLGPAADEQALRLHQGIDCLQKLLCQPVFTE